MTRGGLKLNVGFRPLPQTTRSSGVSFDSAIALTVLACRDHRGLVVPLARATSSQADDCPSEGLGGDTPRRSPRSPYACTSDVAIRPLQAAHVLDEGAKICASE